MGEGEWIRARVVAFIGGYISILMGLFIAICIWLLRHQLIFIWSNGIFQFLSYFSIILYYSSKLSHSFIDPHIFSFGEIVVSIAGLTECLDMLNYSLGGILKGLGRQSFGTFFFFLLLFCTYRFFLLLSVSFL